MALVEYPISDQWVQEMLWARSNPKHVRYDYGKLEMMAFFAAQWKAEELAFFADKEKGVLLRVEILSPLHIGIHVMGDGTKIRGVLREGGELTFEHFKFDVIQLTTLDPRLVAIQKGCGFKVVAEIPRQEGRREAGGDAVGVPWQS